LKKNNKITIDLADVIDLNINIVYSNGIPALQFRKIISTCDKNILNVKSILKKALENDTEIIMPVRLQIVNKPLAIGKLKQAGISLD
jgi:hypothetical protein